MLKLNLGQRDSIPVRFHVSGCELSTSLETTRWIPGSYMDWLVSNCEEEVQRGEPIVLKTSVAYVARLLRRLSGLRERRIRLLHRRRTTDRRKGFEPGPFVARRRTKPTGRKAEICHITVQLPTFKQSISSTVADAVFAVLEGTLSLVESSGTYFDKLVVILTMGVTPGGTSLIWPYLFHQFNSLSGEFQDQVLIQNEEISQMEEDELDALYGSVDIPPSIQHQVKTGIRSHGYACTFSDLKLNLNNFFHWRIARLHDKGIRSLDDDCTVRCLVISI